MFKTNLTALNNPLTWRQTDALSLSLFLSLSLTLSFSIFLLFFILKNVFLSSLSRQKHSFFLAFFLYFLDVEKEAAAAMNLAIEFQNKGKTEKALKIFQHAVALDPLHADILTAFGEFLEIYVKDVVKADHMYKVALENCPAHGRALANRQRTGT